MVQAPESIEIPPKELIYVNRGRLVPRLLSLKLFDLPVDLAAGYAPICEPWRELGRVVPADKVVSCRCVLADGALVEDVLLQALESGFLAAVELETHALVLLGCGFHFLF